MPSVWYVHGFSAGELYLDAARERLFWVDPTRLVLLTPAALRLDDAGTGPGAPGGRELHAGGPLTPYAGEILATLDAGLHQRGYRVKTFGWDWRQDIQAAGVQLADQVASTATDDDPAVLIGHSAGGLVCRAAWADSLRRGRSGLIRRVITIGTPHYGTYYAVAAWSGLGPLVEQLTVIGQVVGGPFGARLAAGGGVWTVEELLKVALTWPALYQLLPVLGAPDAAADPHRAALYDAPGWVGIAGQPSALHLDHARTVTGPWLLSPESMPPDWVLTVASGRFYSTADGLAHVDQLGRPAALRLTDEGDGVVTRASAEARAAVVYTYTAAHSDLPVEMARSGDLVREVLAQRSGPSPVPVSVVSTDPAPVELGGPPFPGTTLVPRPTCSLGGVCLPGC